MVRLLLGSVAALGFSIAGAQAADVVRPAPPPPPTPVKIAPPPPTWQGLYVGVNAGYAWGRDAVDVVDETPTGTFSNNVSGFVGGGQIGYNWQHSWLVIGPEIDLGWLGLSGDTTQPGNSLIAAHVKSGFYADATGRIGVASGPVLIYAKGGYAYFGGSLGISDTGEGSDSHSGLSGWTIGGGVELMHSAHWSIKGEYQYFDFGTAHLVIPDGLPADRYPSRLTASTLKIGLNYRFQ
jgi:outer membrane immunogenic protein